MVKKKKKRWKTYKKRIRKNRKIYQENAAYRTSPNYRQITTVALNMNDLAMMMSYIVLFFFQIGSFNWNAEMHFSTA